MWNWFPTSQMRSYMLQSHLFLHWNKIFAVWHQWPPLHGLRGLTDGGGRLSSAQVEGQCLTERHFYDVMGPGMVELHLTCQSGAFSPPLFPSGPTALLLHSRLTAAEFRISPGILLVEGDSTTEGQMIDNYSILIHKAGISIFQTLVGRQMIDSQRCMLKSRTRVSWKVQCL